VMEILLFFVTVVGLPIVILMMERRMTKMP
jgi:hypothetical protein